MRNFCVSKKNYSKGYKLTSKDIELVKEAILPKASFTRQTPNSTQVCYIKYPDIRRITGIEETDIKRIIDYFEDEGLLIRRETSKTKGYCYLVGGVN